MNKKSTTATKLRALLHGVLNGDPDAERQAREVLYGKPSQPLVGEPLSETRIT